MKRTLRGAISSALAIVLLGLPGISEAACIDGLGGVDNISDCLQADQASNDCLLAFAVDDDGLGAPPPDQKKITCKDGDPCDRDGFANGVCTFHVGACVNAGAGAACTAAVDVTTLVLKKPGEKDAVKKAVKTPDAYYARRSLLADINAGLLYVLALTSLGVYGVIIAGWASNSKYAFLGAMRSAAQIVAYEIAMGFALVGVLMVGGSLNLGEIVRAQEGGLFHWFWLPLFPLFIVYFISGVAEANRAPFDVAEGESEIVAGFHVDYSGMAFAVFFLAEYANMILIAALAAIMFWGGWLSPIDGFGDGIHWFLFKTSVFLFLFLWFRATFPRYRYDQIMRLGWKVFIPITIVWIFVEGIAIYFKVGPWFDLGRT